MYIWSVIVEVWVKRFLFSNVKFISGFWYKFKLILFIVEVLNEFVIELFESLFYFFSLELLVDVDFIVIIYDFVYEIVLKFLVNI